MQRPQLHRADRTRRHGPEGPAGEERPAVARDRREHERRRGGHRDDARGGVADRGVATTAERDVDLVQADHHRPGDDGEHEQRREADRARRSARGRRRRRLPRRARRRATAAPAIRTTVKAVSSTAVRLPPVPRLTMTPAPVPICPSWVQSMTADTTAATRPSSSGRRGAGGDDPEEEPAAHLQALARHQPDGAGQEGTSAGHGQPRGQRASLGHGRSPRTMPE